jgi:hypothetical protein
MYNVSNTQFNYQGGANMPDYVKMYYKLFNSQTDAINLLQKAQSETEEMYISSPDPDIRVLDVKKQEEDNTGSEDE